MNKYSLCISPIFAMMLIFLNSIAGSEIIVILLFVLMFFGAKSIPGMSRSLGRGIRQIKDASQDIQDEIRKTSTDMRRDMNINRTLHEAKQEFEKPLQNFSEDLESSAKGLKEDISIPSKKPASPPSSVSQNKIDKTVDDPKDDLNKSSE